MEEPAEHYNTDTGTKSSIATRVLTSPQRYSTMRSRVPRMREAGVRAPLADYDTDRLGKKFLATAMQDSRRVYAATFSGSNRFGRVISSEAPDVLYDTDVTKNSNANNFVSAVNRSAVRYSNVRSKIRRKGAELITSAPDINYPVDYLNKESLATGVSRSSRKYHIMTTASSRFGIPLRPSTSDDVGPGFYSCVAPPPSRLSGPKHVHLAHLPGLPTPADARCRRAARNPGGGPSRQAPCA